MTQKRAIFYIDGLNLYYLALKLKPQYKWLNLKSLADEIVPDDTTVVGVKYFISTVLGKINQSSNDRQNVYFNALKTIDDIEIILGNFIISKKEAVLTTPLQAELNREKIQVKIPEEKQTDVNLAVRLIFDACNDNFDIAYVITSDTDFIGAIKTVTEVIRKPVIIVAPRRPPKKRSPKKRSKYAALENVASGTRFINNKHLAIAQFPDKIQTEKGAIIKRPPLWCKKLE